MDEPIFPRALTEAQAREAHAAGKGRDDHDMNWHAAAVPIWQAEWDRCEVERLEREQLEEAA